LERDNGRSEWVTLPSLLDQLAEAVQTGRGGNGRGKQGSRPPLDIAAMSLLIEIAGTTRDALRGYAIKRSGDTPRDIRALASQLLRVADDTLTQAWIGQIQHWAGQIRATISNDQDRPWHLHGLPCPECKATSVPNPNGEGGRLAAVTATWSRGYVRAVECHMCGWCVFRGGELDTYAQTLIDGAALPTITANRVSA
jgi:hypothetical protein